MRSRPAIRLRYPCAWSAGANGCRSANSGQLTGSISAAAFSFMVQEPSGIMDRSSAMSMSASRRRYRSIDVSLRCALKTGWVRNSDVRSSGPGSPAAPAAPAAAPSRTDSAGPSQTAAMTALSCSSVVVSSQAICRVSGSAR